VKDDRLYIERILECVDRILDHRREGEAVFLRCGSIQDAVLRNLQILAESTQRLSPEMNTAHPEVEWNEIAGFRNVLVHDFLGIDLQRIWEIVSLDLPGLKVHMESIRGGPPAPE
jgi:uncharacterized protein with HEPN domain